MSKRRKKTEEKIPLPTYKESSISIDPALMGYFRGRGRNALDIELESEDVMMAREIKEMRVEEMNQKRRLRVAKLQKEIDKLGKETDSIGSNGSDMPRISVGMAQQIANLPPDERNKVIETYAMFRSIDKGKGGDSMLPLLIGFSKSNPGTQQSDMVVYAKAMSDQLNTGINLMKAVMPPNDKPSNAMEFFKVMKDLVIEGVRQPLMQAIEKNQPQVGVFEQMLMNPEMFARAKEIGMFGSQEPRTGSTNIDLEIEKLRGERQLDITKLNLEMKKAILEIDAKERRTDSMMAAIAPLSAIFAGPVAQKMQQFGEQQGSTHIPPNPIATAPMGTTILLRCSCGHEESITFSGSVPNLIPCPECGQELHVGGTKPGNNK